MNVGQRGWLGLLLDQAVAEHLPLPPTEVEALRPARARARAHVREVLQDSGLRYGTPTQGALVAPASTSPEERLFLAVLRTFAALALEVADLVAAPPARREDQLLVLFAALTGHTDVATRVDAQVLQGERPGRKLVLAVEEALAERAISLAGDPVYGLVLHNGAVYVDAQCFGLQATDYFVSGAFSARRAARRSELSARQKTLLVEVLAALACAERAPSFSSRRAILRQIEDLKLPEPHAHELRARVKKFFERKPALASVVRQVGSPDLRRFILEQTLLASLVDGRRSPEELAFIQELARVLAFSAEEVQRVEVTVAEFYARNRSVVDVFTVAAGAEVMGEELVESMQRTLEKNFKRLLREARETGELSVLLAQAARGKKLDAAERRKVREQLLDVAKAIPALAIFAAPGGVLLLLALAKVLPFSILPSSFQEGADEVSISEPKGTRRRRG